ncbi:MAG: hypothetical protein ABFD12_06630 [Syntrophorhabdus sp.]
MNGKRIIILALALALSAFILWRDLPIQFPWVINMFMVFVKLFIVIIIAGIAFILAGGKKKLPSVGKE